MRGAPQFHRWRASACWSIVLLVISAGLEVARSQDPSLEYAVKATYLHKFGPFVEWPSAAAEFPGGSFTVCIVGNDPFGALLDRATAGQTVAGHQIAIHRLDRIAGNPGCSVLYATGSQAQPVADILAVVRGMPILTVTDGDANAGARGIINFVIADDRVRFEIDTHVAAVDGLTISSKLLGLAVHVTGEGR
jgi:hypothetical protein